MPFDVLVFAVIPGYSEIRTLQILTVIEQGDKRVYELAMSIDKIFFYCQPIVRMGSIEPVMYELLARVLSVGGETVSAWNLIQEINQYDELAWMLDKRAILFALKKLKQNLENEVSVTYAINLNGATLNNPEFIQFITDKIAESGVNPRHICFEVTEHVVLKESSVRNILALRNCGVLVGIDDFGTGHNSLLNFMQQDYDFIKLAGNFSKGLLTDSIKNRAAVKGVFAIARELEIPLICESVETELIERHLLRLRDGDRLFHGLSLWGQGYFYGREKICS